MLFSMSQSLACLLIHVVFSTRDRAPILDSSVRPALNSYLATVARNLGCECFRVGSVADHVHLAIRISRTITIAQLVEELKTSSSKWLKTQSPALAAFAWQGGYGAFSIGPASLEALKRSGSVRFNRSIETFLSDMESSTMTGMFGVEAMHPAFQP